MACFLNVHFDSMLIWNISKLIIWNISSLIIVFYRLHTSRSCTTPLVYGCCSGFPAYDRYTLQRSFWFAIAADTPLRHDTPLRLHTPLRRDTPLRLDNCAIAAYAPLWHDSLFDAFCGMLFVHGFEGHCEANSERFATELMRNVVLFLLFSLLPFHFVFPMSSLLTKVSRLMVGGQLLIGRTWCRAHLSLPLTLSFPLFPPSSCVSSPKRVTSCPTTVWRNNGFMQCFSHFVDD